MPTILIPILAKITPYILGAIALIGAYFGFKHKVAKEEREKIRVEQQKAIEVAREKVQTAIQKDVKIDQSTRGKIDEIKKPVVEDKPASDYKPGDIFKF